MLGATGFLRAILYNGLGRYEDAFAAAREACEYEDLGFHSWCLIELVEAATRTGEQRNRRAGRASARRARGRQRNGLGRGHFGECASPARRTMRRRSTIIEAIERLERTRIVVHLARTRLLYGEWLRRVNRRVDAREAPQRRP